jgi:hypothetical protein
MKSPQYLPRNAITGGLALALALTTVAPSAYANVFASNAKINGGITNVSVAQGASVSISYILNEPASGGVTIKVLSGTTAVRIVSLAGGTAGAMRGLNTVVWDGKDNGGNTVPAGSYSVSITAAATGYSGWTVTSDDNNDGNYSYYSFGIAVDRNTNSPYYGRVLPPGKYGYPTMTRFTSWTPMISETFIASIRSSRPIPCSTCSARIMMAQPV